MTSPGTGEGTRLADVKKALIYSRLSQDRTGEELGVTRQLEDARKLAEQRGWAVVDELVDNDTSAAGKAKRPGFEAVLEQLKSGRAEVVIAWSLDRLTRNRRDTVRLIEAGQEAKAVIALVRGSDLDLSTASGRMVADLLASVARAEIEVKGERQRRAVEQAVAAGKRSGGRRPFGYTLDMKPFEPEARAVRDAYTMILNGRSLAAVAREWNRRGLWTPQLKDPKRPTTGSPWRGQIVSRVLRKPTNAGLRSYKGKEVGPAVWEPLVSEDVWRAAQTILRDSSRRTPGGSVALLTGVALCFRCGSTVHAGGAATTQPYRIYRCSGQPGHVARQADPVNEYVETIMKLWLQEPDVRQRLLATTTAGPDLHALAQEADAKRRRLDSLAEEWSDGTLTDSQLRTMTLRTKDALAKLEAQLADAAGTSVVAPFLTADIAKVEQLWDGADTEVKRRVIDKLLMIAIMPPGRGKRSFDPASVVVRWR